ncbi:hypothetical protein MTR67_049547 [Solanum verrucosum]|uniref:Uncharacterized protein n=1 Tax=Solanum verrucosum TaxID=315347 RepID=A0AAF0ZXI5_SOLVR|nr:hypothetical protein MTR67_049547 [Solanum verrucosum]
MIRDCSQKKLRSSSMSGTVESFSGPRPPHQQTTVLPSRIHPSRRKTAGVIVTHRLLLLLKMVIVKVTMTTSFHHLNFPPPMDDVYASSNDLYCTTLCL